ncbi:hypothetical protein [Nannocystis pusilla]|uniref:Uncharacterized protein n=1 Tax=Nannocystis pusilla TaxID=889268 RepID=A0ABS7TNJ4_9BACT|nr:hypothetical protein [Nannocystis pusilla]MBZ5709775.1 hypothetical protein [Nannocystis pusilla]
MSGRRPVVVAIVALALAGAPIPARAQEPAPPPPPAQETVKQPSPVAPVQNPVTPVAYDTVVLRDGSVLRGTILELHPEREVIIALASGTRIIAWHELSWAQFAGAAAVGPEASTAGPSGQVAQDSNGAPAADEPAPGPSRPRIFIELERPADVHLFEGTPPELRNSRSTPAYSASRSVCRAPCGKVIDGSAGYPFFIGGERVASSRQFILKDMEGEYVARVKPGRRGLLFGGVLLAGYGTAGTLAGGGLLAVGRGDTLRTAGATALGVGLALLAAGVTMAIHGTTRVRLERRR